MFRIRRRRSQHQTHHQTTRRGPFAFLSKPAFQIGLVIVAVITVILIALLGQQPTASQVTPAMTNTPVVSGTLPDEISVEAAYQLYQSNGAYFLDVRERSEWDVLHIPKTTLLPLGQVAALLDKFPKDKPIILVDATGTRSAQARDLLKQAGYTNVTSLTGGVTAWKAQGYPLEP
jgi:rhodanese-related sulfurtransferase